MQIYRLHLLHRVYYVLCMGITPLLMGESEQYAMMLHVQVHLNIKFWGVLGLFFFFAVVPFISKQWK